MINTLIVSGGNINKNFAERELLNSNYEYIIACDKGLEVLCECNIKPNYIIGDFDSINKNILKKYINDKDIAIKELNPEKDYTDTHMALKLAIKLGSTNINIIGAIGTRIDHTISNIHILKESLEKGIDCKIVDTNNEITLINKNTTILRDENYKYISLIPLTTEVKGITLKGFKYPLLNAKLTIGQSIGISNEQLSEKASIEVNEGILILIKSKD